MDFAKVVVIVVLAALIGLALAVTLEALDTGATAADSARESLGTSRLDTTGTPMDLVVAIWSRDLLPGLSIGGVVRSGVMAIVGLIGLFFIVRIGLKVLS